MAGAKHNTKVEVFEEQAMVGGACRTEYPFKKVPGLGHSTGACCVAARERGRLARLAGGGGGGALSAPRVDNAAAAGYQPIFSTTHTTSTATTTTT